MSTEVAYDLLAATIFILFVGMLIAIVASITVRVVGWIRRGERGPLLLYRDLIGFTGLALSFGAVATARAIDLPPQYSRTLGWLIFTSLPALLGMFTFLYFELRVIGRH